MNEKLRNEIVELMASPEQSGMNALIINDLVEKLRAVMTETPLTQARLAGFKRYIQRMHDVGWVIDPTAYRNALHNGDFEKLQQQLEVLQALADFFGLEEGWE